MIHYKWCICDMDGTLLDSDNKISKENEAALKRLKESGVEVMIASGRLDFLVKAYIRQLDLKGYVISCNGGLIRNVHTDEILYANAMDKVVVQELLTYCMENNVDFLIYTAHVMFSNRNNVRAIRYESLNQTEPDIRFKVEYIDTDDMKVMEGMDVLKFLMIFPTQEEVNLHLQKYADYPQLEVVSSAPGLVDIMALGSSKGKALKILAKKKNINLKEVIAFGDNYNDIDMLKSVGMPIAMENSVEELKKVAKHITKSNDESGIAYAIEHFIKK